MNIYAAQKHKDMHKPANFVSGRNEQLCTLANTLEQNIFPMIQYMHILPHNFYVQSVKHAQLVIVLD